LVSGSLGVLAPVLRLRAPIPIPVLPGIPFPFPRLPGHLSSAPVLPGTPFLVPGLSGTLSPVLELPGILSYPRSSGPWGHVPGPRVHWPWTLASDTWLPGLCFQVPFIVCPFSFQYSSTHQCSKSKRSIGTPCGYTHYPHSSDKAQATEQSSSYSSPLLSSSLSHVPGVPRTLYPVRGFRGPMFTSYRLTTPACTVWINISC
jgi:hypothetical protein